MDYCYFIELIVLIVSIIFYDLLKNFRVDDLCRVSNFIHRFDYCLILFSRDSYSATKVIMMDFWIYAYNYFYVAILFLVILMSLFGISMTQ